MWRSEETGSKTAGRIHRRADAAGDACLPGDLFVADEPNAEQCVRRYPVRRKFISASARLQPSSQIAKSRLISGEPVK